MCKDTCSNLKPFFMIVIIMMFMVATTTTIILFSTLDIFCIFDNEAIDWFKNQFDNIKHIK
jgi:hypothetical protein